TGGLDEMLSKIADFYDEEVDAAVSGLLALMEPVMIVFLGVVVGGMVVAMYLPIFDMVNAAGWWGLFRDMNFGRCDIYFLADASRGAVSRRGCAREAPPLLTSRA